MFGAGRLAQDVCVRNVPPPVNSQRPFGKPDFTLSGLSRPNRSIVFRRAAAGLLFALRGGR